MSERPSVAMKAQSAPDPLLGRTINGRFNIVSLIARGGMGKVYRAEQVPLGRVCALKVLNPNYTGEGDPEFQRRFFLEASIASKLKHPNTVTVFDYGKADDDDTFYMAMELLDGKTLHKAIREAGCLAEERAMHIARQICRSLREAHQMGVIHRDLKPANIFLTEHGDEADFVKVLDFGLVKNIEETPEEQLTHTGLFMGSPKYMAPEQIQGAHVDGRTDVYALGIIMFEMLTGKVPFDRATSVNTLMAHVSDAPPPLRSVRADITVSPALEAIVYRCLSKDPAGRYFSMDEVLLALKQASGMPALTGTGDFGSFQAIQMAARLSASASGPIAAMRGSQSMPISSMPPPSAQSSQQSSLPPGPSQIMRIQAPAPMVAPNFGLAAPQSLTPSSLAGDLSSELALQKPRRSPLLIPLLALIAIALGGGIGFAVYRSSLTTPIATTGSAQTVKTPEPPLTIIENTTTPAPTTSTSSASLSSAPQRSNWSLTSDPDGASVRDNGVEVCNATPCSIFIAKDADSVRVHKLTFQKPGFKSESRQVKPQDGAVSVRLAKIGGGYVAPPHNNASNASNNNSGTSNVAVPPTPPKPTTDPVAPTPSGFKDNPF